MVDQPISNSHHTAVSTARPPDSTVDQPEQVVSDSAVSSGMSTGVREQLVKVADTILADNLHLPQLRGGIHTSTATVIHSPDSQEAKSRFDRSTDGAFTVGTVVGHFTIERYIGGGGMGRVYLALDSALDRRVAIKVLPRQRAHDAASVARFMNEARSAARLNHEHIAQVYFAGEHANTPYIAFEYVEGTNVRLYVERNGVFSLPVALNYLIQITNALSHAATHGVIHRDIKPSNILITKTGLAKVIDMGLARLLKTPGNEADLTASGVTLGTFDYISPEQARDPRNADIRSDIYSLGCTFFFMLTGRPPFPEGTVLQKLLQHQGDEPPDVRVFQPGIQESVAVCIKKMMAKDPRQRYQTPAALLQMLEAIAVSIGLQPSVAGKVGWRARMREQRHVLFRHLPWLVAMSLFSVCLFFFYSPGNGSNRTVTVPLPPSMTTVLSPSEGVPNSEAGTGTSAAVSSRPAMNPVVRSGFWTHTSPPPSGKMTLAPRLSTGIRAAVTFPITTASGGVPTFPMGASHVSFASSTIPMTGSVEKMVPKPQDDLPQVLIVDPTTWKVGSFSSLESAIASSNKSQSTVIELHFDTIQECRPIQISNSQLTIRAGKGYRPVIQFRPEDPGVHYGSMMVLGGNELTLEDLQVEMVVPSDIPADSWTLCEIQSATSVRVSRSRLTVRNTFNGKPYHSDVAFFRTTTGIVSTDSAVISSGNGSGSVSGNDKVKDSTSSLSLRVGNSFLRGEAAVFVSDVARPVQSEWDNTLIATAFSFIVAKEQKRQSVATNGTLWFQLQNSTLYTRRQAIRQLKERDSSGFPLAVEVLASNCIFSLCDRYVAETQCMDTREEAVDTYLKWTGSRNFVENVNTTWWRLRADVVSQTGWQKLWGDDLLVDTCFPAISDMQLVSDLGVRDFVVLPAAVASRSIVQMGIDGLPDYKDAGVRIELLPAESMSR